MFLFSKGARQLEFVFILTETQLNLEHAEHSVSEWLQFQYGHHMSSSNGKA